MTEKLYYQNAYQRSFEARVISCVKKDDLYAVTLDRTAFFPEEGGQYSDSGMLGGVRVISVYESGGIIYHLTESPLSVGDTVSGVIDFDERYEKMQCHTAEHILSGIIHSLYGFDNVGFHLGAEDVTMDVSAPLTQEQLSEVERLANEAVYSNLAVEQLFPTEDEASRMSYRSKLDIKEGLRIIKIGEVDLCACCAPHVAYTGEIGVIKILDFAGLRGGIRIRIAAGRRAQRIFVKMQENLARISALLSVPKLESADAAEKLVSDFSALKSEFKTFKLGYYKQLAELSSACDGTLVCRFSGAGYDEMRAFSNAAIDKVSGMLVLISELDGAVKYIISSRSIPMNTEIKKINTALCGKGGGNQLMVQGSFNSDIESVESYFAEEYGADVSRHS